MYKRCIKCILGEFREEKEYRIVWGSGNLNAKIFVLGEAPGEDEAKNGRPFVGRSGKFLRLHLQPYFDLDKHAWVTNTVLCRPSNNRNPSLEEQEACLPHVITQFFLVRPKIVITAGKVASDWLAEQTNENYEIYQPKFVSLDDLEFGWIPIYHPSYIMRKKSETQAFDKFLEELGEIFEEVI